MENMYNMYGFLGLLILSFVLCLVSKNSFFSLLPLAHGKLLPIIDDEYSGGDPSRIHETYLVHVLNPNDNTGFLTDGDRENWHRSFLPSALLDSGEPRLIYSYKHAISGFAARLTSEEVKGMKGMDGFLGARIEKRYDLQTTYTPAFLGLNQSQGLWPDSNFGQGMIIGVIDSGILPTHPSFNDAGMPPPPSRWKGRCDFGPGVCNNKIIGARAFQSGASPSPLDGNGHGTHVATTAAGNTVDNANVLGQAPGTAVGIAPRAHLAIYKAAGGTSEADYLAGIDQAIEDGVDVLSMSIGSFSLEEFYESGILIGSMAAVERGIFPSIAAGNFGPVPSDIRNDAPWVLTVGASTIDRRITSTVRLGNGLEFNGESAYQPSTWVPSPMEIVYPGANGDAAFVYCSPKALAFLNVTGKVVLCWNGAILLFSNVEKGVSVRNAGGAAMIILNTPEQALTTDATPHVLPVSHLDSRGTQAILNYIASSPARAASATITFHGTQFGATPAPAVGSFSSRGPSTKNGGILKPDIIGPGVNVLAAWPVQVGPIPPGSPLTFNFMSGTSMSTPHLAGIAAMLKTIHPQWSPAAIKSAIMTTANPEVTDQYPDSGPADSYFAMGAGHVDVTKASNPGLIYDTTVNDYASYLCGLPGYTSTQVSIIFRRQIQCPGSPLRVENLNYPSISLTLARGASKTVIRTVTNVGDANSVYEVRISMKQQGVVVASSSLQRLSFTSINEKKGFVLQFTACGTYPGSGAVVEGQLLLVSGERVVRSPISITFT